MELDGEQVNGQMVARADWRTPTTLAGECGGVVRGAVKTTSLRLRQALTPLLPGLAVARPPSAEDSEEENFARARAGKGGGDGGSECLMMMEERSVACRPFPATERPRLDMPNLIPLHYSCSQAP